MEQLLAAAKAVLVKSREIWGDHPPVELQALQDAVNAQETKPAGDPPAA